MQWPEGEGRKGDSAILPLHLSHGKLNEWSLSRHQSVLGHKQPHYSEASAGSLPGALVGRRYKRCVRGSPIIWMVTAPALQHHQQENMKICYQQLNTC